MTSIKGWNGSTWVAPEYCLETSGADTWKKYTPATADTVLHDWQFNSSDPQGWHYNNGNGTSWPDAINSGGEMVMNDNPYTNASVLHHFSPNINRQDLPSSFIAQCSIRGVVHSNTSPQVLRVCLQVGSGSGNYQWVWHNFTGSFGNIVMTTPTESNGGGLDGWVVEIWSSTEYYYGPASLTLYVDWCRILNTNGSSITVPGDPGFIPHYWNGSSWVAQDTV